MNCSSSNRFILMILKRLFKLLPSSHDVVSQIVIRIDPALIDYWNQYRPRHPNLSQIIYALNMMMVPYIKFLGSLGLCMRLDHQPHTPTIMQTETFKMEILILSLILKSGANKKSNSCRFFTSGGCMSIHLST